jgi:hypothetical protein
MAGLLDPFLRGLGGQSAPPPPPGPASNPTYKPRRETRQTPPLSVVRAEIDGPEDTLYSGQLWDISRSGASISLGRKSFKVLKGTEIQLRLRSRHGPEAVTMPSTVRWVDTNHGATFVGLHFAKAIEPGSFLDTFLDTDCEII